MKAIAWTAGIICAFFIMMLMLYYAIVIPAFNIGFYEREYAKYSIAESIKMEREDLLRVTSHMLDYMRGANDDLNIITMVDGVERYFFNQKEIEHMVDVKDLFSAGRVIRNIGFCFLAILAAAVIIKKETALRLQARANLIFLAVFVLLLTVLGLYMLSDFNGAFTVFHELFFSNELWQLNPDEDLLINIVPLEFFIDITKVIAICFLLLLSAMAGLSCLYLRGMFNKHRRV